MNLSKEQKMDALGRIGEKIVSNFLVKEGSIVTHSTNPYDNEKDLIVDGKKVEVKTQVPFIMENAFTFLPKQLKKCRSVDTLFFVAVPAPKHYYKWDGWVFRVDPKKFSIRTKNTKDGRTMYLVDINQEAVNPIQKVSNEDLEELKKYTNSNF